MFFFLLGFYYFLYSLKFKRKKHFFLCGFFLGVSFLIKDIAFLFACGIFIYYFLRIRRIKVSRFIIAILSFSLLALPYVIALYYISGPDLLLSVLGRSAFYAAHDRDPLVWNPLAWLYYLWILLTKVSFIFPFVLLYSIYYIIKARSGLPFVLCLLFIFSYIGLSSILDKTDKAFLFALPIACIIIALVLNDLYKYRSMRKLSLSIICVLLSLGLFNVIMYHNPVTPAREVALDLLSRCPDGCKVLFASETGALYSSSIMFPAFVDDVNTKMRFYRTSNINTSLTDLVNSEKINYIVLIGTREYLLNEVSDVELAYHDIALARYELIKSWNSDVVGRVMLLSTGITDTKWYSYCVNAAGVSSTFCTDFEDPRDAFNS